MANQKHLAVLEQGVQRWNLWRARLYRNSTGSHPDLSGANLFGARLDGIDVSQVDLHDCDLRSAKLLGADFRGAFLAGTRLAGANLMLAHFGAVVIRADIHRAAINMYPPVVGKALTSGGPNVADSIFGYTTIDSIDLSKWSGLDLVKHRGRSTLTIDALLESQGRIPLTFLRGCGIPDVLIDYLSSLSHMAVQFHSCFISYSAKDQDFADRIHADLQAQGVRCWFAPHDIKGGRKLYEQIDEAIRVYDHLLLLLSDASMKSQWVKTEIANARRREIREKRQILFPVGLVSFERIRHWEAFDADTGKDSAREVREYFIPDFSKWKDHDTYQKAFQRLLRDLKVEARREEPTT